MRWQIGMMACIPLATASTAPAAPIRPADLPRDMIATIERTIPGMTITGAERKARDGRVYHDVEGRRPDGAEVELDILQTPKGWEVVEIQRDIGWADVPKQARDAAAPALRGMVPVRVIESRQTDGRIIYELFKADAPQTPAFEVMMERGTATLLTEAWPH